MTKYERIGIITLSIWLISTGLSNPLWQLFVGIPCWLLSVALLMGWRPFARKIPALTIDDIRALEPGIYKIYWRVGDSSLAAVGNTGKGGKWIAPVDWTIPIEHTNWRDVIAVERIM